MENLFLKYSIPELVKSLEKRDLLFIDIANTLIKTISDVEKNTHAWVCSDTDKIKNSFLQAENEFNRNGASQPLRGIPFGVKDIFNTKEYPTQMGSPTWEGFTPGNNARVIDSLVFNGGIVAGKTVTAEFAVHALNETLNPHDVTRTPGTSSSGSAAAVARGMVPFSLATQTAGSIIRPASFCGIWGMKPSFGLVPRTGILKTTDSLDTVGFVTAHGSSLRTILDVVRVKGPDYPFVYKNIDAQGDFPAKDNKIWRVGFVKTHVWETATDYAKDAILDLVKKISNEKNFIVEDVDWPDEFQNAHEVHSTIYNKSLSYYFQNEAKLVSEISKNMQSMIDVGNNISVDTFKTALQGQEIFCNSLDEWLDDYDVVISLGTSSSAPQRDSEELADPSLIWTLGHVPSITAPVFRCPDNLPFGVQFISRKWNDYLLLQGIEELIVKGILPAGSQPINH